MTAGRCKRRKTSSWGGDPGSGASENLSSPSRTSADEPLTAGRPAALGVDLYAQARKALAERCPFDVDETVPRVGTLPSVLAAILQRQSDGRRKHRKVQEEASGPGRPPADFSFWEKTEEYFRPVTLDDIDLLVRKVPPDSCFYLPGAESLPEEVKKDEAVLRENPQGEMDVTLSSAVFKKETDNVEMEAAPATETDSDVTCTTTALPVEVPEVRDAKSLNWILGCKQRFLLTSERPSKKRKHLAGDAGLEQLLLLPCTEDRAEALSPLCDVCCSAENDAKSNRLLFCDSCKVSVHQKCYGVMEMPTGAWLCSWCLQGRKSQRNGDDKESTLRPCLLCPKPGGALKPLAGNLECSAETNFVHLFCSLWTPEVYVDDIAVMEPIMKVGGVQETRRRLVCNLCKVKHGVCVRCSHGTCRTSLHPVCARAAKHQMEIWGKFGHDNVELRAFCLKHSSDRKIPSAEPPSKTSDDDFLGGKLSSDTVPIKRIPKIRITRKGKNKSMVGDGTASSVADEVAKDDTNLDHESLVLKIIPECGDTKSCKMADMAVPDNDNDLPNAPEVIKIFRKIIDHRRINVGDVALELGVSSASLESAMTGEGTVFPLELRLKVIQWLKNIVHVQPFICHSKSRNGSTILSGGLIARDAGRNDSCLLDMLPAVTDPLVVRSQPPCRIKNNKYNSGDDNVFTSTGKASQSDCDMEFFVNVGGLHSDLRKDIVKDTINNICPSHIEERHPEEHNVSEFREMFLANTTCFPDSSLSGELLNKGKVPDNSEVNDMKEISVCSNLLVENAQIFEDDITGLRRDSLLQSDGDACEARITKFKDVGSCSRSDIHPFILKKLNDLHNQWHLLPNPRNIEADCNDYANNRIDTQPTIWMDECHISSITEQLAKANNVEILDLSSADEVEGELLSLQSWLLNRTISMKRSCEKVILSLLQQLPQELDVFRKNRWDMVHVNQYIIEVKEAKKRGRKDRKHKEVQAMLAAVTAAATASRNSLPRKDSNSAVSLSFQQNPLKISSASGRTGGHSLPAPRLKETLSRSSIAKVSSDKHSGNFKLPDFAKDNTLFCDICWQSETIVNRIFVCSSCKVAVHLNCYRRLKDHPNGPWICELCEESSFSRTSPRNQQFDSSDVSFSRAQCSLCGGGTGAFRKLIGGEWVHAFCAEWVLESTYKRGQQNLLEGMDAFSKEKDSSTCYICHYRYGLCLKCSYGHCQTTFHPTCARSAGLFMNLRAIGGRFQHKAYCEKHSADQREKVDSQHGADELKSIKHVRVELEKVRLLCERIIKREKIKRDLVVCSHGILASRRDCAAFSALFHGSFRRGISSESATTTIDNPSYSGTIQRSDDITVDSTVSGRHSGRLLLDVDRKTDDSLTSQLSIKKKIPDRTKFSGKQLPQRPTAAPWNSANGGEKSSKDRKDIRNLQKERL